MKRVSGILLLFIVSFTALRAQVTFEKTYTFWDNSAITGVLPQSDGYILCGRGYQILGTKNRDNFNFIIKTDIYGDTIFTKIYKMAYETNWDQPFLVSDDNTAFYIAYNSYSESYLQKLNFDGDTLWTKSLPTSSMLDYVRSSDGNLVFISHIDGGFQITKTDLEGELIWTNMVDATDTIYVSKRDVYELDTIFTWPSSITSIVEMPNGDYKVSVNYSDGFGEHHVSQYLFTLDRTGQYLGKKKVFSPLPWPLIHAMSNYDEDIIVIGSNDYQRFYISRLNQSGDTIWTRHYLDGIYWGYFNAMTRGSDGNFIMGGMMSDQDNNYVGLFAFTPQGNYLWYKLYALGDQPLAECVALCSDGGFAAGGYIGGWYEEIAYFIKTDANGHISGPGIFENDPTSRLKLYPNPASGLVYLETPPDYQRIEILDLSGRLVYNLDLVNQMENRISISLERFLPGIYLVKVCTDDAVIGDKLVILTGP